MRLNSRSKIICKYRDDLLCNEEVHSFKMITRLYIDLIVMKSTGIEPSIACGTAIRDGGQFRLLSHSLDSRVDSPYLPNIYGALPSPHFPQRGFVWPFICSCSCSWSVSSSF
jgi:hypothetical protein